MKQALIFERTGKVVKSHRAVQSEFHRLGKDDPSVDKSFPVFLTQAYNLKAVADYETGPDSLLPLERAPAAIEMAGRFIDSLSRILAKHLPCRAGPACGRSADHCGSGVGGGRVHGKYNGFLAAFRALFRFDLRQFSAIAPGPKRNGSQAM